MFSGPYITRDFLQGLARNATTDFLANGTPLTEAVVKQASTAGSTLTAEHVRRICEMTYHDTYERMHKQADAADRYVAFDPPDPCLAAELLNAEKVASARRRNPSLSGSLMTEKTAFTAREFLTDPFKDPKGRTLSQRLKDNRSSSPRELGQQARENDRTGRSMLGKMMGNHQKSASRPKFQGANAFDELVKTASGVDEAFESKKIASQVQNLDTDLREAVRALSTEIETVKTAEFLAWGELTKVAYATYKDGHSLEEILHAGFSGLDGNDTVDPREATNVASHLAEFFADKVEKTAGLKVHQTQRLGEIDPTHPLPSRFNKLAALATQRAHMEFALGDLRRDRQYLNEEISETLFGDKTASIRHISTVPYRGT